MDELMSTVAGISALRLSQLLSPDVNGEWAILRETEQGETSFKPVNDRSDVDMTVDVVSSHYPNGDITVMGFLNRGSGWTHFQVYYTDGGKQKRVREF